MIGAFNHSEMFGAKRLLNFEIYRKDIVPLTIGKQFGENIH